jgi:uncharacterized membrane protein
MIRFVLGLLLVFGAVGGMDTVPDALMQQTLLAIVGLAVMYSGTRSMQ